MSKNVTKKYKVFYESHEYKVYGHFRIKIQQIVSIALLPEDEIPDASKEITEIMPNNTNDNFLVCI